MTLKELLEKLPPEVKEKFYKAVQALSCTYFPEGISPEQRLRYEIDKAGGYYPEKQDIDF